MYQITVVTQLFVYTIYRIFSLVQDGLGRTSLGIYGMARRYVKLFFRVLSYVPKAI